MDDQRFDRLARALAGPSPRRKMLRLLAGATGAALLAAARGGPRRAAAHHVYLGPGDSCYDSDQCRGADAPLVCADNGFDYDGQFNCCTYEGNRCGFDAACCGSATCVGGICASGPADACSMPGVQGCPCNTGTRFPCVDPNMVCVPDNPGLPGGSGSCWYP